MAEDTRRTFYVSERALDYLLTQMQLRPIPGKELHLRKRGVYNGSYLACTDGAEHLIEIEIHPMGSSLVHCEPSSVKAVHRLIRKAVKYLQSRTEKRKVIRPVLQQSIFDRLEAYVFDFFKAIDALKTTRGFGNVGIIFTGPAGVGKSETMRWLREEARTNYSRGHFQLGLATLHKILTEGTPLNTNDSLFFIDDIDANILRDRRVTKNPMTSQFLTCLDGLDKQEGRVMVISTNERIDEGIDPALLRPGRFDHVINFDYPTLDLITEFCELREVNLNPNLFEGWSFARLDMFLAKLKVAKYLHQTPSKVFYEKFIYQMGETDPTVEAHETQESSYLGGV